MRGTSGKFDPARTAVVTAAAAAESSSSRILISPRPLLPACARACVCVAVLCVSGDTTLRARKTSSPSVRETGRRRVLVVVVVAAAKRDRRQVFRTDMHYSKVRSIGGGNVDRRGNYCRTSIIYARGVRIKINYNNAYINSYVMRTTSKKRNLRF